VAAASAGICMLAFASLLNVPVGAFVIALLVGITMFTASTASAGAVPPIYPVLVRSGGYGAMMGVGRVGAILTPVLAGIGLQYVAPSALYFAAAVPLCVAALAALRIRAIVRRSAALPQPAILETV
jgi:MFS family permease